MSTLLHAFWCTGDASLVSRKELGREHFVKNKTHTALLNLLSTGPELRLLQHAASTKPSLSSAKLLTFLITTTVRTAAHADGEDVITNVISLSLETLRMSFHCYCKPHGCHFIVTVNLTDVITMLLEI